MAYAWVGLLELWAVPAASAALGVDVTASSWLFAAALFSLYFALIWAVARLFDRDRMLSDFD